MKFSYLITLSLVLGAAQTAIAQGMASMPMAASMPAVAGIPLVNGEVRKLDVATGHIVLRHDEIPNLAMPAMTMGYGVTDKKLLAGLKVGDKVRFRAEMVKGEATVTQLHAVQ